MQAPPIEGVVPAGDQLAHRRRRPLGGHGLEADARRAGLPRTTVRTREASISTPSIEAKGHPRRPRDEHRRSARRTSRTRWIRPALRTTRAAARRSGGSDRRGPRPASVHPPTETLCWTDSSLLLPPADLLDGLPPASRLGRCVPESAPERKKGRPESLPGAVCLLRKLVAHSGSCFLVMARQRFLRRAWLPAHPRTTRWYAAGSSSKTAASHSAQLS